MASIPLVTGAIKAMDPNLGASFSNAIENQPKFEEYIQNVSTTNLTTTLQKFNATDYKAFGSILDKIATNPNYDLNQVKLENIGATVLAEKGALMKTVATTNVAAATTPVVDLKQAFRDSIETPEKMLTEFEKASPDSKGLLEIIGKDEGLKTALHAAVLQDDSVLTGLGEMLEGKDKFLSTFEKALQDPHNREQLATALNNVAASDKVNMAELTEYVNAGMNYDQTNPTKSDARFINASVAVGIPLEAAKQDLATGKAAAIKENLTNLFQDPDLFFANLGDTVAEMTGSETFGNIIGSLGPLLEKMMEFIKNFFGGSGFDQHRALGSAFGSYIDNLGDTARNAPRTLDDPTNARNFDKTDFINKYDKAIADDLKKAGVTEIKDLNIETALKAVVEIDPKTEAEVNLALKAAENDPAFKKQLETVVEGGAESIQQWHEHLIIGESVKNATENTAKGVTASDIRADQAKVLEPLNQNSTVKVVPIDFSKRVVGDLKTGDIDGTKVFNAIVKHAPLDAQPELASVKAAMDNPKLSNVFEKMAKLSPEEIGEAANELLEDMKQGETPALAVTGLNL